MAGTRTLDKQDLEDILNGACLFGCGGGGPLQIGQQLLQAIVEQGKPVLVVDAAEVPDEARLAVAAVEGSPSAADSGPFPWEVAVTAFTKLEAATGDRFAYLLPAEVGAGNTFIALIAAAGLGIPVVDASGAPRAVPTLTMVKLVDAPIGPIVLADGTTSLVVEVADAAAAENTTREIIGGGVFPNFAGVALWSMTGAVMKNVAVVGTLTAAQRLGRALREAKQAGSDPVAAVCRVLGGATLFIGEDLQFAEQTTGGFDQLTVQLRSVDGKATLTIYAENENLIAWNSTAVKPQAMIPDLIVFLTTDGQPFSNADLNIARNKQVAVIGASVHPDFRTPSVLDAAATVLARVHYSGYNAPFEELRTRF